MRYSAAASRPDAWSESGNPITGLRHLPDPDVSVNDAAVVVNIGTGLSSELENIIPRPPRVLGQFENDLAEFGLSMNDVAEEGLSERANRFTGVVDRMRVEGAEFDSQDCLALARELEELFGFPPRHAQGVAIFNLGKISLPGTEKTGRDKGSLSAIIAPKVSIVPYHFSGANAHYGMLNSKNGPSSEFIQGLQGNLPIIRPGSGGHRADIFSGDFMHEVPFGNYVCFSVQHGAWVGLILQPQGSDVRKVAIKEGPGTVFPSR